MLWTRPSDRVALAAFEAVIEEVEEATRDAFDPGHDVEFAEDIDGRFGADRDVNDLALVAYALGAGMPAIGWRPVRRNPGEDERVERAARQFALGVHTLLGQWQEGRLDPDDLLAGVSAMYLRQARNAFMAGKRALGNLAPLTVDDERDVRSTLADLGLAGGEPGPGSLGDLIARMALGRTGTTPAQRAAAARFTPAFMEHVRARLTAMAQRGYARAAERERDAIRRAQDESEARVESWRANRSAFLASTTPEQRAGWVAEQRSALRAYERERKTIARRRRALKDGKAALTARIDALIRTSGSVFKRRLTALRGDLLSGRRTAEEVGAILTALLASWSRRAYAAGKRAAGSPALLDAEDEADVEDEEGDSVGAFLGQFPEVKTGGLMALLVAMVLDPTNLIDPDTARWIDRHILDPDFHRLKTLGEQAAFRIAHAPPAPTSLDIPSSNVLTDIATGREPVQPTVAEPSDLTRAVLVWWVLGNADHCDDCIRLSDQSPYYLSAFQQMGIMPGSGHTACRRHCACHLEYDVPDTVCGDALADVVESDAGPIEYVWVQEAATCRVPVRVDSFRSQVEPLGSEPDETAFTWDTDVAGRIVAGAPALVLPQRMRWLLDTPPDGVPYLLPVGRGGGIHMVQHFDLDGNHYAAVFQEVGPNLRFVSGMVLDGNAALEAEFTVAAMRWGAERAAALGKPLAFDPRLVNDGMEQYLLDLGVVRLDPWAAAKPLGAPPSVLEPDPAPWTEDILPLANGGTDAPALLPDLPLAQAADEAAHVANSRAVVQAGWVAERDAKAAAKRAREAWSKAAGWSDFSVAQVDNAAARGALLQDIGVDTSLLRRVSPMDADSTLAGQALDDGTVLLRLDPGLGGRLTTQDSFGDLLAHEYGHLVRARLAERLGEERVAGSIADWAKRNAGWLTTYADSSPDEFWGEAFALLTRPGYVPGTVAGDTEMWALMREAGVWNPRARHLPRGSAALPEPPVLDNLIGDMESGSLAKGWREQSIDGLKGTSPRRLFRDPSGQEWMWKSRGVAEEALGSRVTRLFGFDAPPVGSVRLGDEWGSFQPIIPNVTTLPPLERLSREQLREVMGHSWLDYAFANEDGHLWNYLVGADGRIWGIDKAGALNTTNRKTLREWLYHSRASDNLDTVVGQETVGGRLYGWEARQFGERTTPVLALTGMTPDDVAATLRRFEAVDPDLLARALAGLDRVDADEVLRRVHDLRGDVTALYRQMVKEHADEPWMPAAWREWSGTFPAAPALPRAAAMDDLAKGMPDVKDLLDPKTSRVFHRYTPKQVAAAVAGLDDAGQDAAEKLFRNVATIWKKDVSVVPTEWQVWLIKGGTFRTATQVAPPPKPIGDLKGGLKAPPPAVKKVDAPKTQTFWNPDGSLGSKTDAPWEPKGGWKGQDYGSTWHAPVVKDTPFDGDTFVIPESAKTGDLTGVEPIPVPGSALPLNVPLVEWSGKVDFDVPPLPAGVVSDAEKKALKAKADDAWHRWQDVESGKVRYALTWNVTESQAAKKAGLFERKVGKDWYVARSEADLDALGAAVKGGLDTGSDAFWTSREWLGYSASRLEAIDAYDAARSAKSLRAGVVVEEPDGRLWFIAPRGRFAGYENTWAKGGVDAGESAAQAAVREVREEMGLSVELDGYLTDLVNSDNSSITRYFIGHRTGGGPAYAKFKETHSIRLGTPAQVRPVMLRHGKPDPRDVAVVDHYLEAKGLPPIAPKELGRAMNDPQLPVIHGQFGYDPDEVEALAGLWNPAHMGTSLGWDQWEWQTLTPSGPGLVKWHAKGDVLEITDIVVPQSIPVAEQRQYVLGLLYGMLDHNPNVGAWHIVFKPESERFIREAFDAAYGTGNFFPMGTTTATFGSTEAAFMHGTLVNAAASPGIPPSVGITDPAGLAATLTAPDPLAPVDAVIPPPVATTLTSAFGIPPGAYADTTGTVTGATANFSSIIASSSVHGALITRATRLEKSFQWQLDLDSFGWKGVTAPPAVQAALALRAIREAAGIAFNDGWALRISEDLTGPIHGSLEELLKAMNGEFVTVSGGKGFWRLDADRVEMLIKAIDDDLPPSAVLPAPHIPTGAADPAALTTGPADLLHVAPEPPPAVAPPVASIASPTSPPPPPFPMNTIPVKGAMLDAPGLAIPTKAETKAGLISDWDGLQVGWDVSPTGNLRINAMDTIGISEADQGTAVASQLALFAHYMQHPLPGFTEHLAVRFDPDLWAGLAKPIKDALIAAGAKESAYGGWTLGRKKVLELVDSIKVAVSPPPTPAAALVTPASPKVAPLTSLGLNPKAIEDAELVHGVMYGDDVWGMESNGFVVLNITGGASQYAMKAGQTMPSPDDVFGSIVAWVTGNPTHPWPDGPLVIDGPVVGKLTGDQKSLLLAAGAKWSPFVPDGLVLSPETATDLTDSLVKGVLDATYAPPPAGVAGLFAATGINPKVTTYGVVPMPTQKKWTVVLGDETSTVVTPIHTQGVGYFIGAPWSTTAPDAALSDGVLAALHAIATDKVKQPGSIHQAVVAGPAGALNLTKNHHDLLLKVGAVEKPDGSLLLQSGALDALAKALDTDTIPNVVPGAAAASIPPPKQVVNLAPVWAGPDGIPYATSHATVLTSGDGLSHQVKWMSAGGTQVSAFMDVVPMPGGKAPAMAIHATDGPATATLALMYAADQNPSHLWLSGQVVDDLYNKAGLDLTKYGAVSVDQSDIALLGLPVATTHSLDAAQAKRIGADLKAQFGIVSPPPVSAAPPVPTLSLKVAPGTQAGDVQYAMASAKWNGAGSLQFATAPGNDHIVFMAKFTPVDSAVTHWSIGGAGSQTEAVTALLHAAAHPQPGGVWVDAATTDHLLLAGLPSYLLQPPGTGVATWPVSAQKFINHDDLLAVGRSWNHSYGIGSKAVPGNATLLTGDDATLLGYGVALEPLVDSGVLKFSAAKHLFDWSTPPIPVDAAYGVLTFGGSTLKAAEPFQKWAALHWTAKNAMSMQAAGFPGQAGSWLVLVDTAFTPDEWAGLKEAFLFSKVSKMPSGAETLALSSDDMTQLADLIANNKPLPAPALATTPPPVAAQPVTATAAPPGILSVSSGWFSDPDSGFSAMAMSGPTVKGDLVTFTGPTGSSISAGVVAMPSGDTLLDAGGSKNAVLGLLHVALNGKAPNGLYLSHSAVDALKGVMPKFNDYVSGAAGPKGIAGFISSPDLTALVSAVMAQSASVGTATKVADLAKVADPVHWLARVPGPGDVKASFQPGSGNWWTVATPGQPSVTLMGSTMGPGEDMPVLWQLAGDPDVLPPAQQLGVVGAWSTTMSDEDLFVLAPSTIDALPPEVKTHLLDVGMSLGDDGYYYFDKTNSLALLSAISDAKAALPAPSVAAAATPAVPFAPFAAPPVTIGSTSGNPTLGFMQSVEVGPGNGTVFSGKQSGNGIVWTVKDGFAIGMSPTDHLAVAGALAPTLTDLDGVAIPDGVVKSMPIDVQSWLMGKGLKATSDISGQNAWYFDKPLLDDLHAALTGMPPSPGPVGILVPAPAAVPPVAAAPSPAPAPAVTPLFTAPTAYDPVNAEALTLIDEVTIHPPDAAFALTTNKTVKVATYGPNGGTVQWRRLGNTVQIWHVDSVDAMVAHWRRMDDLMAATPKIDGLVFKHNDVPVEFLTWLDKQVAHWPVGSKIDPATVHQVRLLIDQNLADTKAALAAPPAQWQVAGVPGYTPAKAKDLATSFTSEETVVAPYLTGVNNKVKVATWSNGVSIEHRRLGNRLEMWRIDGAGADSSSYLMAHLRRAAETMDASPKLEGITIRPEVLATLPDETKNVLKTWGGIEGTGGIKMDRDHVIALRNAMDADLAVPASAAVPAAPVYGPFGAFYGGTTPKDLVNLKPYKEETLVAPYLSGVNNKVKKATYAWGGWETGAWVEWRRLGNQLQVLGVSGQPAVFKKAADLDGVVLGHLVRMADEMDLAPKVDSLTFRLNALPPSSPLYQTLVSLGATPLDAETLRLTREQVLKVRKMVVDDAMPGTPGVAAAIPAPVVNPDAALLQGIVAPGTVIDYAPPSPGMASFTLTTPELGPTNPINILTLGNAQYPKAGGGQVTLTPEWNWSTMGASGDKSLVAAIVHSADTIPDGGALTITYSAWGGVSTALQNLLKSHGTFHAKGADWVIPKATLKDIKALWSGAPVPKPKVVPAAAVAPGMSPADIVAAGAIQKALPPNLAVDVKWVGSSVSVGLPSGATDVHTVSSSAIDDIVGPGGKFQSYLTIGSSSSVKDATDILSTLVALAPGMPDGGSFAIQNKHWVLIPDEVKAVLSPTQFGSDTASWNFIGKADALKVDALWKGQKVGTFPTPKPAAAAKPAKYVDTPWFDKALKSPTKVYGEGSGTTYLKFFKGKHGFDASVAVKAQSWAGQMTVAPGKPWKYGLSEAKALDAQQQMVYLYHVASIASADSKKLVILNDSLHPDVFAYVQKVTGAPVVDTYPAGTYNKMPGLTLTSEQAATLKASIAANKAPTGVVPPQVASAVPPPAAAAPAPKPAAPPPPKPPPLKPPAPKPAKAPPPPPPPPDTSPFTPGTGTFLTSPLPSGPAVPTAQSLSAQYGYDQTEVASFLAMGGSTLQLAPVTIPSPDMEFVPGVGYKALPTSSAKPIPQKAESLAFVADGGHKVEVRYATSPTGNTLAYTSLEVPAGVSPEQARDLLWVGLQTTAIQAAQGASTKLYVTAAVINRDPRIRDLLLKYGGTEHLKSPGHKSDSGLGGAAFFDAYGAGVRLTPDQTKALAAALKADTEDATLQAAVLAAPPPPVQTAKAVSGVSTKEPHALMGIHPGNLNVAGSEVIRAEGLRAVSKWADGAFEAEWLKTESVLLWTGVRFGSGATQAQVRAGAMRQLWSLLSNVSKHPGMVLEVDAPVLDALPDLGDLLLRYGASKGWNPRRQWLRLKTQDINGLMGDMAAELGAYAPAGSKMKPVVPPVIWPNPADLKPISKRLGGQTSKAVFVDAEGNEWLFKPGYSGRGGATDVAVSKIAALLGLRTPPMKQYELPVDGKVTPGSLQKLTPKVKSVASITDYGPEQMDELMQHTVLDYLVANDDSHIQNFLFMEPEGAKGNVHLLAIDKTRSFLSLGGSADSLNPDLNGQGGPGLPPAINLFWRQVRKDPAFLGNVSPRAIARTIGYADAITDDEYLRLLEPVFAHWGTGSHDAGNHYRSLAEFRAAVLKRKHDLKADLEHHFEKEIRSALAKSPGAVPDVWKQWLNEPVFKAALTPAEVAQQTLADLDARFGDYSLARLKALIDPGSAASKAAGAPATSALEGIRNVIRAYSGSGASASAHGGGAAAKAADAASGAYWLKSSKGYGAENILYNSASDAYEYMNAVQTWAFMHAVMDPAAKASDFNMPQDIFEGVRQAYNPETNKFVFVRGVHTGKDPDGYWAERSKTGFRPVLGSGIFAYHATWGGLQMTVAVDPEQILSSTYTMPGLYAFGQGEKELLFRDLRPDQVVNMQPSGFYWDDAAQKKGRGHDIPDVYKFLWEWYDGGHPVTADPRK